MHNYIPSTSILVKFDHTATARAPAGEAGFALLVRRLNTSPANPGDMPIAFARACMMGAESPSTALFIALGFDLTVSLTATADEAPGCVHLLRACGFQGADSHTPLCEYVRTDADSEAISIFWVDRKMETRRLRVAAAAYTVQSARGDHVVLRFELAGADAAVTPAELPAVDSTGFIPRAVPARAC